MPFAYKPASAGQISVRHSHFATVQISCRSCAPSLHGEAQIQAGGGIRGAACDHQLICAGWSARRLRLRNGIRPATPTHAPAGTQTDQRHSEDARLPRVAEGTPLSRNGYNERQQYTKQNKTLRAISVEDPRGQTGGTP